TIEVSVPSQPSFVITARAGYWVDPPLRPRTVRPPTVADTLADRFDSGDMIGFETVVNEQRDVAALLRTVRTSPPVRPADGRRDGAFAIELARVALWRDQPRANEEALRLLAHYDGLMRHPIAPDGLECGWYWA